MNTTRHNQKSSWAATMWLVMSFLTVCSVDTFAQRRLSVIDVETLQPVAGANVVSSQGTTTTDSLGVFYITDSCQTLVFSHVNYESRIVNLEEVQDTIYMISKLLNLKEVVVFGHGKKRDYSKLMKLLKTKDTEAELADANLEVGVKLDLWKVLNALIPKKWRKSYRKEQKKKRMKEILDNY